MHLFRPCFSLDICPGVGFQGHMVAVFSGTSIPFSIVAVPIYISTNSAEGFPSFHILSSICLGFLIIFNFYFSWLCHTACRILIPSPGTTVSSLQWKHGVLTTGPPGKSLTFFINVELHISGDI